MSERRIMVCDHCLRASCWHGDEYCQNYRHAGVVMRSESELRSLEREHPDNYSRERLREVYGW